jgi:hypothetical protein
VTVILINRQRFIRKYLLAPPWKGGGRERRGKYLRKGRKER